MSLAFPTGSIRTLRTNSANPYGISWSRVAEHAALYEKHGKQYGIDPYDIAMICVIESDCTQYGAGGTAIIRPDNDPGHPSVGITQVKPSYHQWMAPNADAYQTDGNIELACAFLKRNGATTRSRDFYAAIAAYHPGIDPNGTTPTSYVATHKSLLAERKNATQPVPDPTTPPENDVHPYTVIGNGAGWNVNYGFGDNVGLNYYSYGVGHGTSRSTDHTGDDVLWPDETPLHAPVAGVVTCVGWSGQQTWGQGCGYFEDEQGGIGNISVLLDSGHKMVFGHSSQSFVSVGERVEPGQKIGTSGGMNGPHTHIEVAVERNGTYWLTDPVPALTAAMGGKAPVVYAARLPIPQPEAFDVAWKIVAARDGVPVLQRADMDGQHVRAPLAQGEDFEAVYIAIGNDLQPYWISNRNARVPLDGTMGPDWLSGESTPTECPPDQLPAFMADLAALFEKYGGTL
jgi:murein DD-endopeptidase MepM/ murein hydrolase activator NlpD